MKRVIRYFQAPSFTEAQWSARNPYLRKGETGYVLDSNGLVSGMKVGPGLWNDLELLGSDLYPYSDTVTNPIGDATGILQDTTISSILKKMLSPYQAPAITNLTNNSSSGGGFSSSVIREIGQSLSGPVQVKFTLSNQVNILGASPVNITAGGTFSNEGNHAFTLPISLLLPSPLNPGVTTLVTISVKVAHTNGFSNIATTSIAFYPKAMWGSSALASVDATQFMAITNKGTRISNGYKTDYSFPGNGYSWLALPSMLSPTGLVFTDVTNPNLPANYAMESKGTISINNGVATYNYDLYRSTFNLISPTILRVA